MLPFLTSPPPTFWCLPLIYQEDKTALLVLATELGHTELARLLIEEGASLEEVDGVSGEGLGVVG